jgi:hypothetical protein
VNPASSGGASLILPPKSEGYDLLEIQREKECTKQFFAPNPKRGTNEIFFHHHGWLFFDSCVLQFRCRRLLRFSAQTFGPNFRGQELRLYGGRLPSHGQQAGTEENHNHYFVSDKAGNCAVVEFIGGEKVYHLNEKLLYKVLTNDIYTESVDFYHQNKIPNPDRFKSIERFIRAADMVKAFDAGSDTGPLDYVFDILKSVSWSVTRERKGVTYTSGTRWSIVYDPIHLRIYFKTFDNQKVRSIRLDAFDFACAAPARIFEINTRTSGDVTEKFVDYARTANLDLIKNAFDKTIFLPKMKDEVLDRLAQYPDSFACQE